MSRGKVDARQVPPRGGEAWRALLAWLRGYPHRIEPAGLHVMTLRGWEYADPTDWLIRLPRRELYRMPDERWRASGAELTAHSQGTNP